jgi:hypothetical protein
MANLFGRNTLIELSLESKFKRRGEKWSPTCCLTRFVLQVLKNSFTARATSIITLTDFWLTTFFQTSWYSSMLVIELGINPCLGSQQPHWVQSCLGSKQGWLTDTGDHIEWSSLNSGSCNSSSSTNSIIIGWSFNPEKFDTSNWGIGFRTSFSKSKFE